LRQVAHGEQDRPEQVEDDLIRGRFSEVPVQAIARLPQAPASDVFPDLGIARPGP